MSERPGRPPFDFALRTRVVPEASVTSAEARLGLRLPRMEVPQEGVVGLAVREAWIEAPIGESGWLVAYRIAIREHRPVVAELRIFPAEPREGRLLGESSGALLGMDAPVPQEFSPRLFKQVRTDTVLARLPEYIAEWRRWVIEAGLLVAKRLHETAGESAAGHYAEWLGEHLAIYETIALGPLGRASRKQPKLRRRRPLDAGFLARVSFCYVKALFQTPRRPIHGTMGLLNRQEPRQYKSPQTVRGYIVRARKAGILTATPERHRGGSLTPYGWQLLREQGLVPPGRAEAGQISGAPLSRPLRGRAASPADRPLPPLAGAARRRPRPRSRRRRAVPPK